MNDASYLIIPIDAVLPQLNASCGLGFQSVSDLMAFLEEQQGWLKINDWEEVSDTEIYRVVVESEKPIGKVFVITDSSYRDSLGAFEMDAEKLAQFVSDHREKFGECLFNGDVFVVSPEQCMVWVFHHEGSHIVYRNKGQECTTTRVLLS